MVNILHNEFTDFAAATFQVLYSNSHFTDVTLVCEDGRQLNSHKIILSSSSTFFRRILLRNPHQYPMIYLRGIAHQYIQLIVQFIYLGQVEIPQEDLQHFLDAAKDLEINGIADIKINDTTNLLVDESENIEIENTDLKISNLKSEAMDQKCEQCDETFKGKNKFIKHLRTVHEGLMYPLSNADRSKLYRERRNSILPKDHIR